MEINKLKGIAERKLEHMRYGCFRGSLNHFLETGTINGSFLEAMNSLITECEGDTVRASEKDLTGMRSYCQCFIPVNEKLPPLGIEVIFQNDKWIHPDFNPQGIRIGFRDDLSGWVSSYYCNDYDCYMTRTSDEDDEDFELSKAEDQIPTKWMPIAPN